MNILLLKYILLSEKVFLSRYRVFINEPYCLFKQFQIQTQDWSLAINYLYLPNPPPPPYGFRGKSFQTYLLVKKWLKEEKKAMLYTGDMEDGGFPAQNYATRFSHHKYSDSFTLFPISYIKFFLLSKSVQFFLALFIYSPFRKLPHLFIHIFYSFFAFFSSLFNSILFLFFLPRLFLKKPLIP